MTQASENLKAAAEAALAEVRELPPSIGLRILGAIDRLTSVVVAEIEAVNTKLVESEGREKHLHECIERLIVIISDAEKRWESKLLERERAHFEQHAKLHEEIGALRGEVRGLADVLGGAAAVARTEAMQAADRAEAAERYVKDATASARAERPSEPAIPSLRHATVPGSPSFESDAPPPGKPQ